MRCRERSIHHLRRRSVWQRSSYYQVRKGASLAQKQPLSHQIVVMGGSKGAELALVAASLNKHIAGVIAFAPSSVVYEGIGSSTASVSSWTYKDVDIPFAPYVHK